MHCNYGNSECWIKITATTGTLVEQNDSLVGQTVSVKSLNYLLMSSRPWLRGFQQRPTKKFHPFETVGARVRTSYTLRLSCCGNVIRMRHSCVTSQIVTDFVHTIHTNIIDVDRVDAQLTLSPSLSMWLCAAEPFRMLLVRMPRGILLIQCFKHFVVFHRILSIFISAKL